MDEKQTFIDSIKSKVLTENELFDEALMCYKYGFNRSAYIVTWISIIESLKQKISSFADLGDVNSKNAWIKIEASEKNKKSADRQIAEEAIKCNIVQDNEESRLMFLWGQRCLFAHPYQEKPTDEQVTHILTEAVNITLGKDINFNKAYLENLCKQIVNYPHFVPQDTVAKKAYFKQILPRVPDILHPFLFKNILREIGTIEGDLSKINELTKLRRFIVELFIHTSVPITDTRFQLEISITQTPYTCWIGYVNGETWHKIPARAKGMLFAYMLNENETSKAHRMYAIVSKIGSRLESNFQSQFSNVLDNIDYDVAMRFYTDIEAAYNRTLNELSSSWGAQNNVASVFYGEESFKFIEALSPEKRMLLGRKFKWAKDCNAFDARDYVNSILNGNIKVPNYFKAGLAVGFIVPSDTHFSLPNKSDIIKMTEILNKIDISETNDAYELMNSFINKCNPIRYEGFHDETFTNDSSGVAATIKDTEQLRLFNTFTESVKQYMAKAKNNILS